jgi:hypothetical protein
VGISVLRASGCQVGTPKLTFFMPLLQEFNETNTTARVLISKKQMMKLLVIGY